MISVHIMIVVINRRTNVFLSALIRLTLQLVFGPSVEIRSNFPNMADEEGILCGLCSWRPNFLQRFASTRIFIIVFGLLGTTQAMSFVYFVATLTTLEKRFQLPSQTMGILMSGNEISQILLVLILSYLGGKGNRPVWIAWGVSISAISCFILAMPHFIYGPGAASLALTEEHLDITVLNKTSGQNNPFTCDANRTLPDCNADYSLASHTLPMVLVFLSQFVLGIGTSLYFSLGQTYLDDNTKKTNTPMMLGVTMALRTLGPACGFILGSLCLTLYVDPSLTPLIERKDPRWLGAWWLGWVILGSVMFIFALLVGMFPRYLPKRSKGKVPEEMVLMQKNPIYVDTCRPAYPDEGENSLFNDYKKQEMADGDFELTKEEEKSPAPEKFWLSLKRILTNPVLMINNFTAVFYIIGASGYINFFNKYTETQYNSSAAFANIVAAVSTILSLVVGFLVSGYIITKFKPRTSFLLLWNIFVGLVYFSGELFLMFLGCPDGNFQATATASGTLDPSSTCNQNCACDSVRYSPVCDLATNRTFFSACHAGCSFTTGDTLGKDMTSILTPGPCPVDCGYSFYLFMATVCFMQMFGCTGRITNVLINYRSVLPQDKAIAQGLALMLISLFAFIPGPIIYGKIIDNACLIWDNTCGEQGNCWLYDKTNFRFYLNITASVFSAIAVLLDIALWVLGKKIPLYDEQPTALRKPQAKNS